MSDDSHSPSPAVEGGSVGSCTIGTGSIFVTELKTWEDRGKPLSHMHIGHTHACHGRNCGGIKVMETSSKSADLREEMCVSVCNELRMSLMDQSCLKVS